VLLALTIYALVAVCVFVRCLVIIAKFKKNFVNQDIEVRSLELAKNAAFDCLLWPWYIIWHGLKQWLAELR
jgi:hypothetical protein